MGYEDIKTADGEEIELGCAYYDGRGTECRPVGIRLVDYHRIANVSLPCLTGKVDEPCCVSMRPDELYSTPPDSWEKLEEDLRRGTDAESYQLCKYANGEAFLCSECRFLKGEGSCARANKFLADVLDRIRELRGED